MVLVYRVPLLNPFRRRRRRRRRFREREKMFDASSVRKKVGDAVSTGRFFLPPERRKRERETHRIFSGLVPVCAATSFFKSPMVSSSLHFTRIFFPRRSLRITSIMTTFRRRRPPRRRFDASRPSSVVVVVLVCRVVCCWGRANTKRK